LCRGCCLRGRSPLSSLDCGCLVFSYCAPLWAYGGLFPVQKLYHRCF
jgi:hypothetical protein